MCVSGLSREGTPRVSGYTEEMSEEYQQERNRNNWWTDGKLQKCKKF